MKSKVLIFALGVLVTIVVAALSFGVAPPWCGPPFGILIGSLLVLSHRDAVVKPQSNDTNAGTDDADEDDPDAMLDDEVLAVPPFTCAIVPTVLRCRTPHCAEHPPVSAWTALDCDGDWVGHHEKNDVVAHVVSEILLDQIRRTELPEEMALQREERERREQRS